MYVLRQNKLMGFTLAELLISLAVLGVITTFTIPKVLNARQNSSFNAIGQEFAAAFSEAYQAYRLENTPTASTGVSDLTPYMNYIRVDTSTLYDESYDGTIGRVCGDSPVDLCLKLANGAIVNYHTNTTFGGTSNTNGLWIIIDPDGKETQAGSPFQGPGKNETFWLYYDGRLTNSQNCLTGTSASNFTPTCPDVNSQPDWMDW